mmetsp:Transcript_18270/g.46409  ORF Transcript_18270/g.46409 Transcript_18270/m.46409 type:complete len:649 (-) Transcript_18270:188-2134(-)
MSSSATSSASDSDWSSPPNPTQHSFSDLDSRIDSLGDEPLLGETDSDAYLIVDEPMKSDEELLKEWRWHRRMCFAVVALCFLGIVICYADRSNIGTAILDMQAEYQWTNSTQGVVLSSFYWGYTIAQIPGGWAAQRFGGKIVMLLAVALWSLFTVLTPPVSPILPLLIFVRILLGLGEGVSFPAVHQLIAGWVPATEHSTAVAVVTAGSYLGTVAANFATPLIISHLSWHWSFYIFGSIGLIWCVLWMPIVPFRAPPLPLKPIIDQEQPVTVRSLLLGNVNAEDLSYATDCDPAQYTAAEQLLLEKDAREALPGAESSTETLALGRTSATIATTSAFTVVSRPVTSRALALSEDGTHLVSAALSSSDESQGAAGVLYADSERTGPRTHLASGSATLAGSPLSASSSSSSLSTSPSAPPRVLAQLGCADIPWALIFAEPGVWAIVLNQFFNSWGFYVLLNWTPTYYKQELGVQIDDLSYLLALPYLVQGLVGLTVGVAADAMKERLGWSVVAVRRIFQVTGMVAPGIMLIVLCYRTAEAVEAMVYLMIALGFNAFTLAGVSVYHLDIAPRYAGVVFGIGNMAGNIPGIVATWSTGVLLDQFHSWKLIFWLAIIQYFLGAIAWLLLARRNAPRPELALETSPDVVQSKHQ